MTPFTLPLPETVRASLGRAVPTALVAGGNGALLEAPLLGVLCSRECHGSVILETLDRIPEWMQAGRVIVCSFHAPLEQQVLRSLLRREGRAVKVLARALEVTERMPRSARRSTRADCSCSRPFPHP